MKEYFKGVRMLNVGSAGPAISLGVEQSAAYDDRLYVETRGNDALLLNAEQVRELVRRMTAWLEGRDTPAVKLWEDL